MPEKGILFTTAAGGDGASGYSEADWTRVFRALFVPGSESTEGVVYGAYNQLQVSGATSPLTIATGAAIVNGFAYTSDTAVALTVPTPSATTAHRVVLRADWAAKTVRVALKSAANGVTTPPAVTQSSGTTWEISLATLLITAAGTITLTDARQYCRFGTKVSDDMLDNAKVNKAGDTLTGALTVALETTVEGNAPRAALYETDGPANEKRWDTVATGGVLYRRTLSDDQASTIAYEEVDRTGTAPTVNFPLGVRAAGSEVLTQASLAASVAALAGLLDVSHRSGGSASDWTVPGGTTFTVGALRVQLGCVRWSGATATSGTVNATFPVAFSGKPLVFVQALTSNPVSYALASTAPPTTSGFQIVWAGGGQNQVDFFWIAIGAE